MNDTSIKLDEVIFFFEQLKLNIIRYPFCAFYLSAFISAARSVTFIMQKEYAYVNGFREWWKNYDKSFLDKFNDLRVIIIHQKYPAMSQRITTFFGNGLNIPGGTTVEIPINLNASHQSVVTTSKGTPATQIIELDITTYYENQEKIDKKDVKFDAFVEEANQYLELLRKIVNECESKFKLNS